MNVSSLEGGGGNKWYPWLWINIFEAISLSNTTLSIRCLISRNRDGWYNINGRKRNINALAGGQSHEKCTEATRAAYVIFAWGIKRLFANEKCPSLKRSNAVGLGYHIYIFRENIVRGFASLSNGDLIKYSLWSVRCSTRVSPCIPPAFDRVPKISLFVAFRVETRVVSRFPNGRSDWNEWDRDRIVVAGVDEEYERELIFFPRLKNKETKH